MAIVKATDQSFQLKQAKASYWQTSGLLGADLAK